MSFTNELKPPLEEVLEHYGVLGMKWGVRKDRKTKRTPRTPEQKKAIRKKVAVATLVTAGTIAAILIIKNEGARKVAIERMQYKNKLELLNQTNRIKMRIDSKEKERGEMVVKNFDKSVMEQKVPKQDVSPDYAQMRALERSVKPDEFITYDNKAREYVISKDHGYNPNTQKFGPEKRSKI